MTRVLDSSSNTVTSRMSDHNNLISSRYIICLKQAFSLMIAIDYFFLHSEKEFQFQSKAMVSIILPVSHANIQIVKKNKNVIHANC